MQVVGYETGVAADDEGPARLLVGVGGEITGVPLAPGTELSFSLGERCCAGTIRDGEHVPCDADEAPYCDAHAGVWVCARCTGTCLKDEMDCHETHVVYLAAFAPDRFKVGVTRLWRLETRLREQGADRGARVRTVADGRRAREIEAELAAKEDLVDRVRVPTKRAGLAADLDDDAWESLLSRFDVEERFEFSYGLDVDDRPVDETVAAGRVVGTKGRLLVLERGGTAYAVDVRDLVGYELDEGRPERALQSSLGAFDG